MLASGADNAMLRPCATNGDTLDAGDSMPSSGDAFTAAAAAGLGLWLFAACAKLLLPLVIANALLLPLAKPLPTKGELPNDRE
jgi:hypothetical protein